MKKITILLLFSFVSIISIDLNAQFNKSFNDQKALRLNSGDTLLLQKTAVVLDSIEFEKIRINLEEYKTLKISYLNNIKENKKLITQLSDNHKRLSILLNNNELQAKEISELRNLVNEMSDLSADMKVVNQNFESNNMEFDENLDVMKKNNLFFDQEIRE